MRRRLRTIVVIPTYNEAENLALLVAAILSLELPDLGILVVDDDSPDGTGRLADELAARHPGVVKVLHRHENHGFGPSYIDGFRYALQLGTEYIVQMDADFSHQPRYLPALLAAIQGEADLVIGSRYVPGGSVAAEWHFLRRGVSRFANQIYVRLLLGLPVRDATGGFRAYKRGALSELGLDEIRSNGYSFQVETAFRCHCLGYRIGEVPIHFPERERGSSKMNWRIALEAAWRVLQFRWRYRNLRPAGGLEEEE